jgi:23S rRNA (adenine-N6)-dimethyltransferase
LRPSSSPAQTSVETSSSWISAPARGATEALARVVGRVLAVELDPELARGLRHRWSNVEVVEGDAARVELPREPFSVVANVPFARTTDILHRLLDDPGSSLRRADLIVEWDVAHKFGVPWPSSVKGVVWSAWYEASVARRLPRDAFVPAPSVDAGVLVIRRRAKPLVPPALAPAFHRFVASGFRHGLRTVVARRELERIGARAIAGRDLDAHQWAALFMRRSRPDGSKRLGSLR